MNIKNLLFLYKLYGNWCLNHKHLYHENDILGYFLPNFLPYSMFGTYLIKLQTFYYDECFNKNNWQTFDYIMGTNILILLAEGYT